LKPLTSQMSEVVVVCLQARCRLSSESEGAEKLVHQRKPVSRGVNGAPSDRARQISCRAISGPVGLRIAA
jgi:hypothetical protein